MDNPYQPPKSSLQPPGSAGIRAFPRLGTLLVVALGILTLGIYLLYWLYTRTRILNSLLPSRPVPAGLINFVLSTYIVVIGLSLVELAYPGNQTIGTVTSLINLVSSIGFLIWVFIFRERLNHFNNAAPGQRYWLGPILTFFFQSMYFQYKINQMLDEQNDDGNSEMTIEA